MNPCSPQACPAGAFVPSVENDGQRTDRQAVSRQLSRRCCEIGCKAGGRFADRLFNRWRRSSLNLAGKVRSLDKRDHEAVPHPGHELVERNPRKTRQQSFAQTHQTLRSVLRNQLRVVEPWVGGELKTETRIYSAIFFEAGFDEWSDRSLDECDQTSLRVAFTHLLKAACPRLFNFQIALQKDLFDQALDVTEMVMHSARVVRTGIHGDHFYRNRSEPLLGDQPFG